MQCFKDFLGRFIFLNFSPATAEKIIRNLYYTLNLSFGYSKSILKIIKSTIMRYAKKSGYIYDISDFEEITIIKRRPLTEYA